MVMCGHVQTHVDVWLSCISMCGCMSDMYVCVSRMGVNVHYVCLWEIWGWVVVCLQIKVFWKEWGWGTRGVGGCGGGNVWIGGNCD